MVNGHGLLRSWLAWWLWKWWWLLYSYMLTCCFWLMPDEKRHITVPKSLIMCILVYSFELAWRACFNRLPWKSPSTDSFDKVNPVQGHSGFSVLPVSQSVFQCSGAVLVEVKGPTNLWSLFETVKKPDVFHGRKRIFMNFSAKFTKKFGRQISYWFWVLVKCVASGTSWTFFSKILNSICHRVKSWNNKKHTHRLMRPSFGWLWL